MTIHFSHRVAVWGLALVLGIPFSIFAKENNDPAKLKVDASVINRDVRTGHSYSTVIKKASPSVVTISSTRTMKSSRFHQFLDDPMFDRFYGGGNRSGRRGGRAPLTQESLGSGVIVTEDGYILTNNHVVEGADADGVEVALADGKRTFTAKVIGNDPQTDIAVLKVDAKDLPAITLADSDKLEVGDVCLAIGNPFNVGQSVTMGIVSALSRGGFRITDYEDFIQTDAAINPGNSGGALVDAQGRLIGINQSIVSQSGGSAGIGFAVPVNLAKLVLERLVTDGTVRRGFLGVMIQEVTPELAGALNLSVTSGALVSGVVPNTPAAQAGIEVEDVITAVNGKQATDSLHARLLISQNLPGAKVSLTILRSGKEKTLTAELGEMPGSENATLASARGLENSERDALDGVQVDDLDAAKRQQFGIPDYVQGVFVVDVDPGSNAYESGIRAGSVIQGIDRQSVKSADEAVRLSAQVKGDKLLVRVWSQSGEMSGSRYVTVDNKQN